MSLNIINITPVNGSINVLLDQTFLIEFDAPVDPFTVVNGISLYTIQNGLWSGPDLAILDSSTNNILDTTTDDYLQFSLKYTIDNNKIYITPVGSLVPDRTHFLSIFPGNDPSRYISTLTTSDPIYSIVSSGANLNILSAYTGNDNNTFDITISANNKIDVTKGSSYVGEFPYILGEEINLGELKISLTGIFNIGDNISIDVFKAQGLTSVYKTSFTTSKYNTLTPQSEDISTLPGNILDKLEIPLTIISTIPENLSINNNRCNPITIKFNKSLNTSQDLLSKINIIKTNIITGLKRNISFYYKVNNDTVKIYLV